MGYRQSRDDGWLGAIADRMIPSAGRVMNQIVVAGGADPSGDIDQVERVPEFPGDNMVGAGGVAAEADRADKFAGCVVEGQSAAEYVYPADFLADERIVRFAVVFGRPFIGSASIHGI